MSLGWKNALKILGLGAVATGGVILGTNAAVKAGTRKQRRYLEEPEVVCLEGELYEKQPDGTLKPYWNQRD